MTVSRHGRGRNHSAAGDPDDASGVRFDVLDELQAVLHQLAGTDPFEVFGPQRTPVGMLVFAMLAVGADWQAATFPPLTQCSPMRFDMANLPT